MVVCGSTGSCAMEKLPQCAGTKADSALCHSRTLCGTPGFVLKETAITLQDVGKDPQPQNKLD